MNLPKWVSLYLMIGAVIDLLSDGFFDTPFLEHVFLIISWPLSLLSVILS